MCSMQQKKMHITLSNTWRNDNNNKEIEGKASTSNYISSSSCQDAFKEII